MPRKLPPVVASLPPPPTSPLVTKLRQDWRWAGISQFIWTFADAFGIVDWDIEALERDFDGSEDVVVPDLVSKLLYSLTWNRQINRENAFENLRKQYLKRLPERNVLGTLEEPVEWATLGLSQKVEILWQLCEWQLDDPARFRSLLKTEDDSASWRVDPIGWDKAGNTYFLFDDNRLWVQRVRPAPPRPPKKSSLKAKRAQRALNRSRPPPKKSHKKKEPSQLEEPPLPPPKKEEVVSGPRRRTQVVFYGNLTPTVEALKRGTVVESTPRSDRSTRSSARIAQETPSKPTRAPPLPLGTRVSRRLRAVDDEWQHVPDEWLETPNKAKRNAGRDDDQESELSELTDEEVHEARLQASGAANGTPKGEALREKTGDSPLSEAPDEPDSNSDWKPEAEAASDAPSGEQDDPDLSPEANDLQPETEEASVKAEDDAEVDPSGVEEEIDDSQEQDEVKLAVEEAAALPDGFIEWEAVCVTLQEWNSFPEQWAKSKDADEKALYRLLVDDVRPQVLEVLEAKEQERLKQEAINNRKRSSRIATRELAREEELKRELAEREMEERMERMRQEETRKAQEEADILARERAREDRMRERQERLMARENAIRARQDDEVRAKEKAERDRERRKRRRDGEEVVSASEDDTDAADGPRSKTNASTPGSSTQNASWELRCEVCLQTGWNLKDEADTVCCDDCGRWQHVTCHDRRDIAEGRGIRDWEQVDFRCKESIRGRKCPLLGIIPNPRIPKVTMPLLHLTRTRIRMASLMASNTRRDQPILQCTRRVPHRPTGSGLGRARSHHLLVRRMSVSVLIIRLAINKVHT
ncbi:hypothetical protein Q8F55_008837 [Vanrija albida]|uniref:Zinc finger PHD-type domain-containing protein n=1 Tax=Vanrija albida TaxID=181172 RepID=A0ABR3PS77_9TREE